MVRLSPKEATPATLTPAGCVETARDFVWRPTWRDEEKGRGVKGGRREWTSLREGVAAGDEGGGRPTAPGKDPGRKHARVTDGTTAAAANDRGGPWEGYRQENDAEQPSRACVRGVRPGTWIVTVDPVMASRPATCATWMLKLYLYESRPRRDKAVCALPTAPAVRMSFLICRHRARQTAFGQPSGGVPHRPSH